MKKFHEFLNEKNFIIKDNHYHETIGDFLRGIGGGISGAWHGEATSDSDEADRRTEEEMSSIIRRFGRTLAGITDPTSGASLFDPEIIAEIQQNLEYNYRTILDKTMDNKRLPPSSTSKYKLSIHTSWSR